MEAAASGVDRWANRNECAKVGVFVFCLALSGEKWKKHRTKMVVQAPFVLQSKNKSTGTATNLHSKPLLLRNALMRANLRSFTSQRQRSAARKGVNQ